MTSEKIALPDLDFAKGVANLLCNLFDLSQTPTNFSGCGRKRFALLCSRLDGANSRTDVSLIPEARLTVEMTGLHWKSDWPVAVIHPKLRERELLRNGTRGAIFLGVEKFKFGSKERLEIFLKKTLVLGGGGDTLNSFWGEQKPVVAIAATGFNFYGGRFPAMQILPQRGAIEGVTSFSCFLRLPEKRSANATKLSKQWLRRRRRRYRAGRPCIGGRELVRGFRQRPTIRQKEKSVRAG